MEEKPRESYTYLEHTYIYMSGLTWNKARYIKSRTTTFVGLSNVFSGSPECPRGVENWYSPVEMYPCTIYIYIHICNKIKYKWTKQKQNNETKSKRERERESKKMHQMKRERTHAKRNDVHRIEPCMEYNARQRTHILALAVTMEVWSVSLRLSTS